MAANEVLVEEPLRDITQTAELLGVSRSFFSKLVNTDPSLPHITITSPTTGREVKRFRLSDVIAYFEGRSA